MLRLIVGVSRKIGLPSYCSAGATCQIEVELTAGLLDDDLQGFRDKVRSAFAVARQAVDDELAALKFAPVTTASRDGCERARSSAEELRRTRRATARQVQALAAIARDRQIDIDEFVTSLGVKQLEDLSITQASQLIGQLRATPTN